MPATFSVRAAAVDDAPALADLAAETFPLACPPGFDPGAIAAHIRRRLSADAFRINMAAGGLEYSMVLLPEGRAVGYLLVARTDPPQGLAAGRLLELRQIYVRREYHGSPAGDLLMAVAVARAGSLGLDGLWLGTSKVNARAIAFYRRHGFDVAGERVFLVDDLPNEDWIMVRGAAAPDR